MKGKRHAGNGCISRSLNLLEGVYYMSLKSNGFGSFQQLIAVSIDQYWTDELLKIDGSKLLQQEKHRSLIQIPLWSCRTGDDETVVYEIRYMLTALGVPFADWSIDWSRSNY